MKPRLTCKISLTATEAHQIIDSAVSELNDWQLVSYLAKDSTYALISGILKLEIQEKTGFRARLLTEEIEELLNSVIDGFYERQLTEYLQAKDAENPWEHLADFSFISDPLVRGVVKLEQRFRTITN